MLKEPVLPDVERPLPTFKDQRGLLLQLSII